MNLLYFSLCSATGGANGDEVASAKQTVGVYAYLFIEEGLSMGKILIIAEKTSAGKDIARILGVSEKRDGYFENNGMLFRGR